MSKFEFLFVIGSTPVFECAGHYYKDNICTEEVSYGMFTENPVGMEPIESTGEFKTIQTLIEINRKLKSLSLVGYDKGVITVAVEYCGEYQYFRLFGFSLDDLNESLAWKLTSMITRKNPSEYNNPYTIKKQDFNI